ncbi:VOC family protein [Paludibaculum fermentans]|uniref:VOC family protein n=1 Tax=Paludibaculum fermentans TaxID=1473598 RepID=UPI003EB7B73A
MNEQQEPAPGTIHSVQPYLRLRRAAEAIDFYRQAFGAEEIMRLTEPGGRIGHAEIRIGPAVLFLADEYPELGIRGPESLGGATIAMHLSVDAVDAVVERASQAGAAITRPPKDEFYGQRTAVVRDPFGHEWMLAQTIEEVSPEELQRRFEELTK